MGALDRAWARLRSTSLMEAVRVIGGWLLGTFDSSVNPVRVEDSWRSADEDRLSPSQSMDSV